MSKAQDLIHLASQMSVDEEKANKLVDFIRESRQKINERGSVDKDAARELEIFLPNHEPIYRQLQAVFKNLVKKFKKKMYDKAKAVKAWLNVVDNAAKMYVKEYGTRGDKWSDMFNKPTRLLAAQTIADEYDEMIQDGEEEI